MKLFIELAAVNVDTDATVDHDSLSRHEFIIKLEDYDQVLQLLNKLSQESCVDSEEYDRLLNLDY